MRWEKPSMSVKPGLEFRQDLELAFGVMLCAQALWESDWFRSRDCERNPMGCGVNIERSASCASRTPGNSADRPPQSYITGGTVIPITPSSAISSRRTTAAVASRNFFRASSASFRMWWR